MNLEITKSDFEKAVPAAREPKGKIFEVMEDAIKCKLEVIGCHILGEPGISAVEDSESNRFWCSFVQRHRASLEDARGRS